jgi:hypothetical protein
MGFTRASRCGPGDAHGGRLVLLGFDEIIRAEAHVLALVDGGDVIHAVLADGHAGDAQAVFARAQRHLGSIVEEQRAVRQRPVRLDGHVGIGAFDGAQIAAGIFDFVFHPGPAWEMISDFEFLDAGQVDHLEPVLFGTDAAGFHVVVERLGHAGDQKLVAGPAELRTHVGLFPFR